MIYFNRERMKQHFPMSIPFHIIAGFVQFLDDSLLLFYSGDLVEALQKVRFRVSPGGACLVGATLNRMAC